MSVAASSSRSQHPSARSRAVPWQLKDDNELVRGVLLGEDPSVQRELGPAVLAAAAAFKIRSGYRLINHFRYAVGSVVQKARLRPCGLPMLCPYLSLGSAGIFILIVLALADIISGHGGHIKHLDKITWVFIVILLPLIGSVLWFVVGREWGGVQLPHASFGDARRAEAVGFTARSTEDELAALEREIAFHERQDKIRRLEAELKDKAKGEDAT